MRLQTPSGLDEIIRAFGSIDDPNFERDKIVIITLPYTLKADGCPIRLVRCHKLLAETFVQVFEQIRNAQLTNEVKNFGALYARRSIRGQGSHPSLHSWGIAIDLEPNKYLLGSDRRFPPQVLKIFRDAGFFYGGDLKSRRDPSHFQYATNY